MANIDYKQGSYTIPKNTAFPNPGTPQDFTFWWGRDSKAPFEFFDVFVSPELDKTHRTMTPLVEVERSTVLELGQGPGRVVLVLKLRNDNPFDVTFVANHVRIYS